MPVKELIRSIALPIVRWAPAGKGPLYDRLVGPPPQIKSEGGGTREWRLIRDKSIGAFALCDLNDGLGRRHFYYGRDTPDLVLLIIHDQIGPGDTFIDVGAHKGIFTLGASGVVGKGGKLISFEPNPDSNRIVAALLTIDGISNCTLHPCGLSDVEGSMSLARPSGFSEDRCTFRSLEGDTIGVEVPVRRADGLIGGLGDRGKILVKVDTEGFEHHAILGFGGLLDLPNISFFVEVTDEWLRNTGTGAAALFQTMKDHGFSAYLPVRIKTGTSVRLAWTPIDAPPAEYQVEIFFTKKKPS